MRSKGYTEEQASLIHSLAEKGTPDSEIIKYTNVNIASVKSITTKFWATKMKNKKN